MKSAYRLIFLLSGAFALGVIAGNGVGLHDSVAQGYHGLFSDPNDNKHGPLGYKGLIPGYTPPDAQEAQKAPGQEQEDHRNATAGTPERPLYLSPSDNDKPPAATAAMTVMPGYVPRRKLGKIENIRMAGLDAPLHMDWSSGQLPPQVAGMLANLIKPEDKALLARPTFRIQGMLPEEFTTKEKINHIMAIINAPNTTAEARRNNAAKAREKLLFLSYYLKERLRVPGVIYQQLGMPESYAKEEHEGMQNSLDRVEATLKDLKKYE